MVNYHDPVTIAREYSAYAILPSFCGLQSGLSVLSTGLTLNVWHFVNGIFMSVSQFSDAGQAILDWLTRDLLILAGNSSLPFTLSGM